MNFGKFDAIMVRVMDKYYYIFCETKYYNVNNIITFYSYAIDGDWTHDGDIPALKNEQGHYNNMIKVKPSDNPFDQVLSTKIPNPDNISRGLSGFIAEHRPFNKKIKRCLSGDETLVLSDAENVLSLSETLIDDTLDANEGENDDLLSGDEELLPTDNIISMAIDDISIMSMTGKESTPYFLQKSKLHLVREAKFIQNKLTVYF